MCSPVFLGCRLCVRQMPQPSALRETAFPPTGKLHQDTWTFPPLTYEKKSMRKVAQGQKNNQVSKAELSNDGNSSLTHKPLLQQ